MNLARRQYRKWCMRGLSSIIKSPKGLIVQIGIEYDISGTFCKIMFTIVLCLCYTIRDT